MVATVKLQLVQTMPKSECGPTENPTEIWPTENIKDVDSVKNELK